VTTGRSYDLVSLGEPLLRLSPPRFGTLETARTLDVMPCGAQMNVAADLALLGWRTALLTKLPDNPFGRLILEACRGTGVDTSHIKMVEGARMGLTFVEFSAAPRTPLSLYDRDRSAASTIGPGDFNWSAILSQARMAYADGIFPALNATCRAAAQAYLETARQAGCTVVFDLNYRSHLWSPEEARAALEPLLEHVDVLVTNRAASETIFELAGTDEELMRGCARRFGCRVVCLTSRHNLDGQRGRWESQAMDGPALHVGRPQEYEIVDRYGTGDVWLAAFLYARQLKNTAYALDFANAAIALAHTTFGDVVRLSVAQVEAVMAGRASANPQR
jgi:2-dehydro-3-deoxygluconokinase